MTTVRRSGILHRRSAIDADLAAETVDNGCMRVLPGSHTRHLMKSDELVELDT